MWQTFFRDGGFGMYPTAVFGALLVASSVLHLLRPEGSRVALLVSLGVGTLGAGLLGATTGIVKSFHYLPTARLEDRLTLAALGCAESLNNVILALILVVLSSLLCAAAALRAGRSGPMPDPAV
jgi:hypothetical protein